MIINDSGYINTVVSWSLRRSDIELELELREWASNQKVEHCAVIFACLNITTQISDYKNE